MSRRMLAILELNIFPRRSRLHGQRLRGRARVPRLSVVGAEESLDGVDEAELGVARRVARSSNFCEEGLVHFSPKELAESGALGIGFEVEMMADGERALFVVHGEDAAEEDEG